MMLIRHIVALARGRRPDPCVHEWLASYGGCGWYRIECSICGLWDIA